MAIKEIIAQGIGFSPGSTKYIPTLGFEPTAAAAATPDVSSGSMMFFEMAKDEED